MITLWRIEAAEIGIGQSQKMLSVPAEGIEWSQGEGFL